MLEFVKSDDGGELFVCPDEAGWEAFQGEIEEARRSGDKYLFSPEWGLGVLTVTSGSRGSFHK